jgi:hypothetical protein
MISVEERRDGPQKHKICTSQLEALSARKSPNRICSSTTPLQLMKQEKENRTRISSSHPTRSSIKPRPRRRCIITARLPEHRGRHRSKGLTITHLLLPLLVLLEIGGRGRLPGGVGLELFLFFDLHEVALEAFEVAGGGLDEVFGLVGGFEGFEEWLLRLSMLTCVSEVM